jgi:hypothetical protein
LFADKHSSRSSKESKISENEWVLSANDRDVNLSLTNDGLSVQSKGANTWQGCRANRAIKKVLVFLFLLTLLNLKCLSFDNRILHQN